MVGRLIPIIPYRKMVLLLLLYNKYHIGIIIILRIHIGNRIGIHNKKFKTNIRNIKEIYSYLYQYKI